IRVIYNGIDPTRLDLGSDAPSRSSLGIAPDALVIVSVGSLIARKGHDVTIRALAELRTRGVDAHLVVCGDGDAESELAELAGGLGVAERLHLLGMRQDVGAIITTLADVYVSAAHSEALPLNVLEAQFLGRPVIASDIPAHQEAIAVERTGLLFPDGDPMPLADGLARLTAHPGERASFGQAGRARATAEFLVERYRREFYQLYEELLAAPASRFGFLHGPTWPATYGPWLRQVTARALRGTRRVQPVN
ncbi:MAG: glycosyltransferase, partial [Gemmatirosa sp.]